MLCPSKERCVMALIRSGRETKVALGPWRSVERVVEGGKLKYAVGALIPREEAERQGLLEPVVEEPVVEKSKRRKKQET